MVTAAIDSVMFVVVLTAEYLTFWALDGSGIMLGMVVIEEVIVRIDKVMEARSTNVV